MNNLLQNFAALFETVAHPAGGKLTFNKKRKNSIATVNPKATPDSLNIRDLAKRQDSYRRNPAP